MKKPKYKRGTRFTTGPYSAIYKVMGVSKKSPYIYSLSCGYRASEGLLEFYLQYPLIDESKRIPPRSYHGSPGWKYSADSNCFYKKRDGFSPPSEYCLGDRYIHCDYGRDSHGIVWRGSTSINWHGASFGYDLKQAIEWVQSAKFSSLGAYLWGQEEKEYKNENFPHQK